jgi:hypothetical protein
MDSSSQADNPLKRTSLRLANIAGTLIALLTLILPLVAIAYFSSTNVKSWQPSVYPVFGSRDSL